MDVIGHLVLKGLGQIKNARVENVAVDPQTPNPGSIWYNTTDGVYRGYDGTTVVTFASGGNTETILAEINTVETSAGLNSDGTLPSLAATNYLTASNSLFAALVALDAQAKTNADALATTTDATNALSTRVGAVITSEGLNADGTFKAYTGSNYLTAATDSHAALVALDAQAKTAADAITAGTEATNGKVSKAGDNLTGNLTFGGTATVTGLKAPEGASDAATKNYVDNAIVGLSWKDPVDAVTADLETFADPLEVGDRLLNSTDFKIYTVTTAGDSGADAEFDAGVLLEDGDAVFDKSNETGFVYSGTSLVQFTGGGQIAAGVGLVKTGNQLDVNMGAGIAQLPTDEVGVDVLANGGLFLTVDGTAASTDTAAQLSIKLDGATLVRANAGLKIADGGVGVAQLAAAVAGDGLNGGAGTALSVDAGEGLAIEAGQLVVDLDNLDGRYLQLSGGQLTGKLLTAGAPDEDDEVANKAYVDGVKNSVDKGSFLYTSTGSATTHTVTHNIGSKFNHVTVIDSADNVVIPDSIVFTNTNELVVGFTSAITCKIFVSGIFVQEVI